MINLNPIRQAAGSSTQAPSKEQADQLLSEMLSQLDSYTPSLNSLTAGSGQAPAMPGTYYLEQYVSNAPISARQQMANARLNRLD